MDLRGESRGSYGTGSQYSESTVINQDITDPDLFPSELGYKGTGYQPKVVGLKSPSITPKPKDPDDHVQLHGPIQPTYKVKGIDLMARLVDRPENSQALRMAKGLGPVKKGPVKPPQPESPKVGKSFL
ncbi:hypothetical protein KUTeg_013140 [Tegillarca granosa]|uniref:Uncharacterized protein n=1 Tax=Tegillarca granosa TaxID=220873 RepID=A0ABQ9EV99_TEGGR|nr:hypothetical protein KUTeg_013140 [Tegillarca granosa]